MDGQGWTRTSSLLFVRQALSALELLARQSMKSLCHAAHECSCCSGLVYATRPRFGPGSQRAFGCATGFAVSFVEAFWSPALAPLQKTAGKSRCYCDSVNYRLQAARSFLSQAGPRMSSFYVAVSISLSFCRVRRPETTKATLSGRPRNKLLFRHRTSGSTSKRGRWCDRAVARARPSASWARRPRRSRLDR